ncbi:uncharacterized protein LOC142771374 [Rhipicephalus microplus]|uniref:uncharacterized protein LOC142771374 n=1 Tax=Rhipicephalus microplus TaxID=6941 RepID=UPI003F6D5A4C
MTPKDVATITLFLGLLSFTYSYYCPLEVCKLGLKDNCYKHDGHTTYRRCVNSSVKCGEKWKRYCPNYNGRRFLHCEETCEQCICECCNRDRLSTECFDVDDQYPLE